MKTRNKALLAVVLLAVGFIAIKWRNSNQREAEGLYHAKLVSSIKVSSQNFKMDEMIPSVFTCKGQSISPEVSWVGAPEDAASYALVVTDPDTPIGIFAHWILYDIPKTEERITEGVSAVDLGQKKIMVGQSSAYRERYEGPCPPYGTHQYVFRIYALNVEWLKPASMDRQGVLKSMEGHVLAYGELIGRFSH